MNFTIQLNDSTIYTLVDTSFGSKFSIDFSDKAAFLEAWDKMTRDNLSKVIVRSGDTIVTTVLNLILDGTQAVYNGDGTVTGHFYFHGGEFAQPDAEYIEAAKILLGEE